MLDLDALAFAERRLEALNDAPPAPRAAVAAAPRPASISAPTSAASRCPFAGASA